MKTKLVEMNLKPDKEVVHEKDFEKGIQLLRWLLANPSTDSYYHVREELLSLQIPLPHRRIPKGQKIARTRRHKKGDESFFCHENLVSYRRDVDGILDFGRCNEPKQSAFYGATTNYLAFMEASDVIRNKNYMPFEIYTTGVWEVVDDLYVVNLLASDSTKENKTVLAFDSATEIELLKSSDNSIDKQLLELLHFMSDQFARKSLCSCDFYKVTSAFSNYVFSRFGKIDGIVYPSTIYPTQGVNIVLRPKSVDDKLNFLAARKSRIELIDEYKYKEVESIDCSYVDSRTGQIYW